MSLLEEQDRERIIKVVNTLDFTDKKVKEEISNGGVTPSAIIIDPYV
jgi:hypothetical protein